MNKDLIKNLVAAGGLIAVAMAAASARAVGLLDGDTVTRIIMGAIGLMLVWYGNSMPKAFAPEAKRRQIQRMAAWSMVLSGLTYLALWAFAPLDFAFAAGCGAVVAGLAVTIAYCLSLGRKAVA